MEKKKYTAPELKIHGSIDKITQTTEFESLWQLFFGCKGGGGGWVPFGRDNYAGS